MAPKLQWLTERPVLHTRKIRFGTLLNGKVIDWVGSPEKANQLDE